MGDPIRIEGIRQLNTALKRVDTDLPKQTRLRLNEFATGVASAASRKVPRRSGRAAGSYRAASTRTAARIAIGGRRAPYAPWLDFGGRVGPGNSVVRPFYKSGRYLFPTFTKMKPQLLEELQEMLVDLGKSAGMVES